MRTVAKGGDFAFRRGQKNSVILLPATVIGVHISRPPTQG